MTDSITSDSRFDEAESEVERGKPWLYREQGMPNPLTIEATQPKCWSTGHTKLGEAEFLHGADRTGRVWSVLVGGVVLTKGLIDGVVEQWDEERDGFVVTATLGRVEPGEVVSIRFLGDRQGAKYEYPDFAISRKPARPPVAAPAAGFPSSPTDDQVPF